MVAKPVVADPKATWITKPSNFIFVNTNTDRRLLKVEAKSACQTQAGTTPAAPAAKPAADPKASHVSMGKCRFKV